MTSKKLNELERLRYEVSAYLNLFEGLANERPKNPRTIREVKTEIKSRINEVHSFLASH